MEVTCAGCNNVFEVELPAKVRGTGTKGCVVGIPLEEMTIEQLRIEKRNAKSVLYKSQKAGRPEESLIPKQMRVDAVEAMLASKLPQVAAVKETAEVAEAVESVETTEV
jgi:hypothetical protein